MTKIEKKSTPEKKNGPFGIVYQEILYSDKLTLKGKIIYCALTTYLNGDGKCWPSLRILQKKLGISRPTIILRCVKPVLFRDWI